MAIPSSAYASARTGSLILATTFGMRKASVAELRGHDVAVVALGHRQEDVRIAGTGPDQDVLVGPVAADGAPAERRRQAVEGVGVQVEDQHLVTGHVIRVGDGGAHAAAAHDHDLHDGSSDIGSRTTQTAHGALCRT